MKLFVEVNAFESLQHLLESDAHVLVIGLDGFCGQRVHSVTIEELEKTVQLIHKYNKQCCLLFPYIILETQFSHFETQLSLIASMDIDYIACGDVGLGHYLTSQKTSAKLIFMNETMIANPFDAQVFLDSGYDLITPAVDITLSKKLSFAQKLPSQVLFQWCGTHLISTSKRPLLSSYYDVIDTPHASKQVTLRELTREETYFGIEDDQGFHIFHDKLLVLDDPIILSCTHGYLSSLFVPIEETLKWIQLINTHSFTFENVSKHSSFKTYKGLEETDKGLEAGT